MRGRAHMHAAALSWPSSPPRHLLQLAYNHYERPLPGGGLVPFLISWDPTCADFLPPNTAVAGCTLTALRAESPAPAAVTPLLRAVGIEPSALSLTRGERPRLVATLETPRGTVELG